MSTLYETGSSRERVLLTGACLSGTPPWEAEESLDELERLAHSAGAEVGGRFLCRLDRIHAGHYIGSGKAEEIARWIETHPVDTLIFDEELSPVQGRNLEEATGVRVIDRTQLILDIFAQHAQTREGRLQIELAQHQYLLPRLRRMWTHLERQKGGIGLKGPGETQLEMDRRRIQQLIRTLNAELEQVRTRRGEQRKNRHRGGWALISLVGYTNAGKSTLLNALTGAHVTACDQLFATLDPITRQINLPNHEPTLLSDTVGFIRKLPHTVVAAFKSTLEEAMAADLLLHVIDSAHPQADRQIEAVNQVLSELNADHKPLLCVLNKIDHPDGALRWKRLARGLGRCTAVSARTGEGLDELRHELADCLRKEKQLLHLRVPLAEGRVLALIRRYTTVLEEEYDTEAALLTVRAPAQMNRQLAPYRMPP